MSRKFLKYGWIALGLLLALALVTFPACTTEVTPPGQSLLLRVATTDILVKPWNSVAGSDWAYDHFVQVATLAMGAVPDPNNGLYIPWRMEKAEVTVKTGLPVTVDPSNTGWCTLSFSPNIDVPADAWADWNATTQKWIPAGTGRTAMSKTVVYYPKDIFDVKYHDGSKFSPADFILYAIMQFDRAKPASSVYDESYVAYYEGLISHLKGLTFDFSNPNYGAIVTTYDDQWYLDAEWIVGQQNTWYPVSTLGEWNFENISLGILAEANGQLAFSETKAEELKVEWLNYVAGPSLTILSGDLDDVLASGNANYQYIPYAPTLGKYITGADALTRYQNLKTFYNEHHHFYVGTGPYYLNTVNTAGEVVDLKKFTGYNEPGNRFFDLMTPEPTGPVPANKGGWVDEIVVSMEPTGAAAVTKLLNDELDVYAYGMTDADLKAEVDANTDVLHFYWNSGAMNGLTFNPYKTGTDPFFADGALNPFAIPAIREAMNKVLDRSYISNNLMHGFAIPKMTIIGGVTVDAQRFASLLQNAATKYAYDKATADATIRSAMLAIPDVTVVGGKYQYKGAPVTVRVLMRNTDERLQIGHYVQSQLEDLGFTVTYKEGGGAVLSAIWQSSNPSLGPSGGDKFWSIYTSGFVAGGLSRDEGPQFGYMYTDYGVPFYGPLWGYFTPTPEFYGVCKSLFTNSYTTVDERNALFAQAIDMSLKDSTQLWLVDRRAYQPLRTDVAVAADAAGGIYNSWLWAATIHFRDASGVPIVPAT